MKHQYTGHPSQSVITCIPNMSFYHQETELFSIFPRLFGIDKISKLLLRYFTCRGTVKKLVLLAIYSETKSLFLFPRPFGIIEISNHLLTYFYIQSYNSKTRNASNIF